MTDTTNNGPDRRPSPAEVFWDNEFGDGRYLDAAPDPFVGDILATAGRLGFLPGEGLYVGVGNGRNHLPLVAGGLDLLGLDISSAGLNALAERVPGRRHRLIHGSLDALPAEAVFPIVVGIQVFQHGTRDVARALLVSALQRVAPGGLFCLRVNAVGTEIVRPHDVIGEHDDGSTTVRYRAGGHRHDKAGLAVHFYSRPELEGLFADFDIVLPLRLDRRERPPEQGGGTWAQWEAIVRRPGTAPHGGRG